MTDVSYKCPCVLHWAQAWIYQAWGGRGFNWCCQMQHRHPGSSWCGSRALKCFPSPSPCRLGLLFTLEKTWTQFFLQQMLIFQTCGREHLFLWEGGEMKQLNSLDFSPPAVRDAVAPSPLLTFPISVCRAWVGTRRRQHSQDHRVFSGSIITQRRAPQSLL